MERKIVMGERWKEWAKSAVQAAVVVAVLYFVFFPVKIQGESMENSFHDGDRVAVSRLLAVAGKVNYGDVVVFSRGDIAEGKDLIKRVIALSGDQIIIEDNHVQVNGVILFEDYVLGSTDGAVCITVPEDCVFVMGDNRAHSMDSRQFGVIKKDLIKARVVAKLYPFDELSFL